MKKSQMKKFLNNNRFWCMDISPSPVELGIEMKKFDKTIKNARSSLYFDNRAIRMAAPVQKRQKLKFEKISNYLGPISDNAEKILDQIYDRMKFMTNESKELHKINSLSLQRTSKKFFRTSRPKTSTDNPITLSTPKKIASRLPTRMYSSKITGVISRNNTIKKSTRGIRSAYISSFKNKNIKSSLNTNLFTNVTTINRVYIN